MGNKKTPVLRGLLVWLVAGLVHPNLRRHDEGVAGAAGVADAVAIRETAGDLTLASIPVPLLHAADLAGDVVGLTFGLCRRRSREGGQGRESEKG